MEAAAKRRKIQEEEQRKKDKVKDRMDLIRQMKGVLLAKIDTHLFLYCRWNEFGIVYKLLVSTRCSTCVFAIIHPGDASGEEDALGSGSDDDGDEDGDLTEVRPVSGTTHIS